MEFSRPEYWNGQPFSSPRDLPNPGIEARSPALQADSLPAERQGKPKNTGVGSLSLLQQIFPAQELNQGLLHCRRILSQLSSQGSPKLLLIQYKYFYNLFSDIVLRVIHFDTYSSCSFIFAGFIVFIWGSLVVQIVKNPPVVQYSDWICPGSVPGSGKSPGEGNGNPLQHSCTGSPVDPGA